MSLSPSRNSSPLLVCLGDLVEDIVVWHDGPTRPGTDNPATITRARGGSAANVAVLAAHSMRTRFIGRVGADAAGRALGEELAVAGVEPFLQRAGRTGVIVVQIDETAERTMYPDRAAAAELADVPAEWVDDARILHISAYALATGPSARTVLELADRVRHQGGLVSVDAASADLLLRLGDRFRELLSALRPQLFFANADERALVPSAWVTDRGGVYVTKNGADPVEVRTPQEQVLLVDVPPVPLVLDTTGAGDAFAAGFLVRFASDPDLTAAVNAGNAWAATVLGTAGAAGVLSTDAAPSATATAGAVDALAPHAETGVPPFASATPASTTVRS